MKKILISQRIEESTSYKETRSCLDLNWGKLFKKLNFIAIPFLYTTDIDQLNQAIKIDGIILTGGNSLASVDASSNNWFREEEEISLIKFSLSKNIPLLGVCKGMQLLGNFFGSTLSAVDNQIKDTQTLLTNANSKYAHIWSDQFQNNSYHTYKIDSAPQDFISGASSDNIIKSIEHKNLPILGIMWHPERNNPFKAKDLDLLQHFFKDQHVKK